MDQDTTPSAGGALLLGALNSSQADLLGEMLRVAYTTVRIIRADVAYNSPEDKSLSALWDDLHGLSVDALAAERAAHERESGPEIMAAARRLNQLDRITAAEQLLAAERIPSAR